MESTTQVISYLRDSTVRSTCAFFALSLLISIGAGILIAASTRGLLQIDLPAILPVIILLSPTIAAIVLTVATTGWSGLYNLVSSLSTWRIPIQWYLVALFLPAVLNLSSIGIYVILGGSLPAIPGSVPSDLKPFITDNIASTLLFLSLFFFLASLVEEIGWRGYALPQLQSRLSAFSSSCIIGVIWAFWHVPSFFLIPRTAQAAIPFLWYIPSILAISVVFTWLYNNTSGSLLLVTILHASIQATNILIPNLPSETGDMRLYGLNTLIVFVVTVIILRAYGAQNLSRNQQRITQ